jgi:hypothetical protein
LKAKPENPLSLEKLLFSRTPTYREQTKAEKAIKQRHIPFQGVHDDNSNTITMLVIVKRKPLETIFGIP